MRILKVVIAIAVATSYALATSHGEFKLERLLEALMVGGLTFFVTQLSVAEDTIENARELADTAKKTLAAMEQSKSELQRICDRAIEEVNAAKSSLAAATTAIGESADVLARSKSKLDATSDQMHGAMRGFEGAIKDTLNKVRTLFPSMSSFPLKGLSTDEQLSVTSHLNRAFGLYSEAWATRAKKLDVGSDALTAHAWSRLCSTYLDDQRKRVDAGRVRVSAEVYTSMISQGIDIVSEYAAKQGVAAEVLLLSGMLPTEFYNWPQAERLTADRQPAVRAYTWAGAHDWYRELLRHCNDQSVLVTRCLLARADDANDRRLLGLHPFRSLRETANLYIHDWPMPVHAFASLNLDRVLTRSFFCGATAPADMKDVVSNTPYHVFPIGTEDEFSHSLLSPHSRLIPRFAERYHSTPEAAHFAVVHDQDYELITALLPTGGGCPELAIFRVHSKDGTPIIFGLRGEVMPLSPVLFVDFLAGNNAKRILPSLEHIDQTRRRLSTLCD